MEYNMKNIFPQKSYAEYGRRKTSGKTSPRPFSEKASLNISLDQ